MAPERLGLTIGVVWLMDLGPSSRGKKRHADLGRLVLLSISSWVRIHCSAWSKVEKVSASRFQGPNPASRYQAPSSLSSPTSSRRTSTAARQSPARTRYASSQPSRDTRQLHCLSGRRLHATPGWRQKSRARSNMNIIWCTEARLTRKGRCMSVSGAGPSPPACPHRRSSRCSEPTGRR